ncbi:MAG: hypothetical protein WC415_02220 [Patescibacteria group bacterium]|jgi:hypothetical protein
MKRQLLKALEIAAITGDKVIVVDEKTDQGLVVMGLGEYEQFLFGRRSDDYSLTENDSLDNINDVAFENNDWENDRESEKSSLAEAMKDEDDFEEEDDELPDIFKDNEKFKDSDIPFEDFSPLDEIAVDKSPAFIEATADKVDEDENLYYYEEPTEKAKENKEKDSGFTSIQDELKEKRKWEIPPTIKKGAEEVINKN